MIVLACAVVLMIVADDSHAQDAPARRYTSPRDCAYSFEVPADWVVTSAPNDQSAPSVCAVEVRPSNFAVLERDDFDAETVYSVRVELVQAPTFLEAAAEHGFNFHNGSWVLHGRHGVRRPAAVVRITEATGIRGTAEVGCYGRKGYVGLCDVDVALLESAQGKRWVAKAGPQAGRTLELILQTLSFSR